MGAFRGPQGRQGASAYEVAWANGYRGTTEEWLNSLKGKDGKNGLDGVSLGEVALVQELSDEDGSEERVISQKTVTQKVNELADDAESTRQLINTYKGKVVPVTVTSNMRYAGDVGEKPVTVSCNKPHLTIICLVRCDDIFNKSRYSCIKASIRCRFDVYNSNWQCCIQRNAKVQKSITELLFAAV